MTQLRGGSLESDRGTAQQRHLLLGSDQRPSHAEPDPAAPPPLTSATCLREPDSPLLVGTDAPPRGRWNASISAAQPTDLSACAGPDVTPPARLRTLASGPGGSCPGSAARHPFQRSFAGGTSDLDPNRRLAARVHRGAEVRRDLRR
jgi:hypothetical protein